MIIIDVRTKEEYDAEHISGAINIDVHDMMNGMLPNIDTDLDITVYCGSGRRSQVAKHLLEQAGFHKVTDGGGIQNLK
ncbi:MAG: hypothetical protein RL094_415 [Candidatus Parcubacteria bacterium]|jgi:rhodanese-related sulfurtransferase